MESPTTLALREGDIFHERYRVVRCIRAGGMGAVYEVHDERTDTPRALKLMLPDVVEDADLRARFEREARITGKVQSEHLVRITDAGIEPKTVAPFLVMELLQGEELGGMVKRQGPLRADDAVIYLWQVALALEKTHAAGIIHRDLKPANLFLSRRDDGSPCVKILDFGIARRVSPTQTATLPRLLGTPVYMAPEQMRSEKAIGPAADIHALGHTAYTLLVGEPYWKEEMTEIDMIVSLVMVILEGMKEPPTARAKRRANVALPPAFDAWLAKAAAPKAGDRFASAAEAIRALAEVLSVPLPYQAAPSAPGAPVSSSQISGVLALSSEKTMGTEAPVVSTPRPESTAARARKVQFMALAAVALLTGALAWKVVINPASDSKADPAASAAPAQAVESAPAIASPAPSAPSAPSASASASTNASANASASAKPEKSSAPRSAKAPSTSRPAATAAPSTPRQHESML